MSFRVGTQPDLIRPYLLGRGLFYSATAESPCGLDADLVGHCGQN
jgi:hypothetical protein